MNTQQEDKDLVENQKLLQSLKKVLDADAEELELMHKCLQRECFNDSSAVHTKTDLKAWLAQKFIRDLLKDLHSYTAGDVQGLRRSAGDEMF